MVEAAQLFPKYFWFIIAKRKANRKEPAGYTMVFVTPIQSYFVYYV